jgi:electron transfer flavoprotein alpha subunit
MELTMERILCLGFAETDGSLGKPALESLNLASSVHEQLEEATLVAGLVGKSLEPAVDQLAGFAAETIYRIEGEDYNEAIYSSDAAAAELLSKTSEATIVVASGTSRVSRILPGVAQRLNGRIDTHICDVHSEDSLLHVTRWYYRQRMRAVMTREHRPWFIVSDPGSFTPWSGTNSTRDPDLISLDPPDTSRRTRIEGFQEPESGEQTIRPDAELLLVAGAGWTKSQADGQVKVGQAEELILDFLEKTSASLGGSKSMVDLSSEGQEVLSFMSHLNQIGQTGSSPRHPKGLATCCHGEEPHVVGWRFIRERRAINTDPNCGWVQGKADVVYIADAFAVMTKVNELLSS